MALDKRGVSKPLCIRSADRDGRAAHVQLKLHSEVFGERSAYSQNQQLREGQIAFLSHWAEQQREKKLFGGWISGKNTLRLCIFSL